MATVCCCSMAGTKSCAMCSNNPYADPTRKFSYYVPAEYACKFKENKPKTNADKIRAMTDEELAHFISEDYYVPHCPISGLCLAEGEHEGCEVCWLNWLKQEVADG